MRLFCQILNIPSRIRLEGTSKNARGNRIANSYRISEIRIFGPHIMKSNRRYYGLLKLIFQGKIEGKRSVGRRRVLQLRNLRGWFGETSNYFVRHQKENKYLLRFPKSETDSRQEPKVENLVFTPRVVSHSAF